MLRPIALSSALSLALASPFVIGAAPFPTTSSAQSGTLAQVQQHLKAVKSMTAGFSQRDRNGRVLTGTMTLKQPGKIRFQYEKGVPQLIVADGKSLWFLDYQVRQVERYPIGDSPLGVLLNPNRDLSRFAKIVPSRGDVISVEARDPKHPEYGIITLIFERRASAPGGLMLQGWVALDAQNNRTTIQLSNQKFNAPVSDRMFRFNDPRRSGPPNR